MASVAYLFKDAENIINEIEKRIAAAEENAVKNFVNARIIQKIIRGYITRKHVELLHQSAICIQKYWRAFKGRILYRARLKEKYDEICWKYYCAKAKIIQKNWKGYWIRSKVFSYYQLKAWLKFVTQQNKFLKCSIEMRQKKENSDEMEQREDEAKEWIIYILFKLHHLLRTRQLSGIYSLPNTTKLSDIEMMLKCLRYKDFMIFYNAYKEDVHQAKTEELPSYILQQCKYLSHYEREYYEHKKPHKDFLFSNEPYVDPKPVGDLETRCKNYNINEGEYKWKKTIYCQKCGCKINDIQDSIS